MSAGKQRLQFKAPQLTLRKTVPTPPPASAQQASSSAAAVAPEPQSRADPWTDSGAWGMHYTTFLPHRLEKNPENPHYFITCLQSVA